MNKMSVVKSLVLIDSADIDAKVLKVCGVFKSLSELRTQNIPQCRPEAVQMCTKLFKC